MPIARIPFHLEMTVDVYVNYEGDPKDAEYLMLDDEFGVPTIYEKAVEPLGLLVPHSWDVESNSYDWRGIDWHATPPRGEHVHDWQEFVDEDACREYFHHKKLRGLIDELEMTIGSGDYKALAGIAAQLAELAE